MSDESEEIERKALLEQAELHKVKVDNRWSTSRLREEVNKARGVEKLPARAALINKVVALGMAEDEVPSDWSDAQLEQMVEKLRNEHLKRSKKSEMARQKELQGSDFGKTANIRVLKLGDSKISTGIYIAGIGNMTYDKGDVIPDVPLFVAKQYEERGYAEILEGENV